MLQSFAALALGLHVAPLAPAPRIGRSCITSITAAAVANEFARPVSVGSVERRANRMALEATPEECAALAERFELKSIGSLVANVSLSLVDKRRTRVRASGKLTAADVKRVTFSGAEATVQVWRAPTQTSTTESQLRYCYPCAHNTQAYRTIAAHDVPFAGGGDPV